MEQMQTQEMISALADGQLRGDAFAQSVQLAASDPVARDAWHTYHLIGDALRSGQWPAGSPPAQFLAKLQARLQQEQRPAALPAASSASATATLRPRAAANDASFRWKLVAGAASIAAVAAIGWSAAGGGMASKPEQAQLAAAATAPAASAPGVMIRDPRLDEFLAAHRQLGSASALQMPTGFLRNATFDSSSR
jgi:sigma-E factor negative regulatory protein RseA